jgi:hypothetical protein
MQSFDLTQLREQATTTVSAIVADPNFDLMVVGTMLGLVVLLSLFTIWRGRRSAAVFSDPAPSESSGFLRWLTPMGMKSVSADQATVARPRRSGSNKTIRVSTPVSRVSTRSLKSRDADALEISRRSGLARDAVVMMMANADPKAHAKKVAAAKPQPAKAPVRTAAPERAMSAPGAGNQAPRTAPSAGGRTLGTQFTARLS